MPYDRTIGVQIRNVTPQDSERLLNWRNLNRAFFNTSAVVSHDQHLDFLQRYFEDDCAMWFVIEAISPKGNCPFPVGQVCIYEINRSTRSATFGRLILDSDWRGLGLSAPACKLAIAQAEGAGITSLALEVRRDNARAMKLYKKLGFVEVLPREVAGDMLIMRRG